jgi:hypothetical protein
MRLRHSGAFGRNVCISGQSSYRNLRPSDTFAYSYNNGTHAYREMLRSTIWMSNAATYIELQVISVVITRRQ